MADWRIDVRPDGEGRFVVTRETWDRRRTIGWRLHFRVGGRQRVDVESLTGMKPHREQAVEMIDIGLEADPPAEVDVIDRHISWAQSPETEQMDQMPTALGKDTTAVSTGAATGSEAARVCLETMIAREAADSEIENGKHGPDVALAKEITSARRRRSPKCRPFSGAFSPGRPARTPH